MENPNLIPFIGIQRQYKNLRDELLDASDRVYRTGKVLDGDYTKLFEIAMRDRCDREYAVAVNSCTQGLLLTLNSILESGSKILVPSISFAASINAPVMAGLSPVFCDTDDNGLMDLESIDFALDGAGVGAIMYANLWGHTVDWDRFKMITEFFNDDMCIIEDAAQSFGAYYKGIPSGKMGYASVLSFDPTKNLPNFGSGGMVLTDDLGLAENLVDLRDNGKLEGHHFPGTNSKMSESDCAQMLVKLKYFDAWQARRKLIADYYIQELYPYVDIVLPSEDVESAWHKFVIRLTGRHALKHHLNLEGIETKIHYDKPLFELPIGYGYIEDTTDKFVCASAFSRECLSLPIYPELTDSEVTHITESIIGFLR